MTDRLALFERPVRVGRFDLLRQLGHGAMGVVWRARLVGGTAEVAVKLMRGDFTGDPWAMESFAIEVRASAGLSHPGIVRTFDSGFVDGPTAAASDGMLREGTPYLVMEVVNGEAVRHLAGALPWPLLRSVLLQLLDALAHSHARGVVHRDMKPGNVLLVDDPQSPVGKRVMLTDFGLAHAIDLQTADKAQVAGTPAYMAPEQFSEDGRELGPWTDLYSLGCMTWALATRTPPFGRLGSFDEAAEAHAMRDPPALRSLKPVPPGFEDWLRWLMEKDPMARPRSAAEAAWGLLSLGPAEDRSVDLPSISSIPALGPDLSTRATGVLQALESLSEVSTDREFGFGVRTPEGSRLGPLGVERMPIPPDWRRPAAPPWPAPLRGVGMNLYGLRAIPLVGRQQERDELWAALRWAALARKPAAVVLRGGTGTGKSRLAEWLCERAHELGAAQVLRGLFNSERGPTSGIGAMFARMLRVDGLTGDELRQRLRRVLPRFGLREREFAAAMADLIHPEAGTPAPGEVRLRSSAERHAVARQLLRSMAEKGRPVVIWLDDVQWGGDGLAFVEEVLAEGRGLPVLLVMTVQEDTLPRHPDERARLERILAHSQTRAVDVSPLSSADAERLVRQLLGLEAELADRIARRTAGNPLFAMQLVRDWIDRGLLEHGPRGFRLRDGARVDLPRDMHQAWRDRVEQLLGRLPLPEARALEVAAVLGNDVSYKEWQDTCALTTGAEPSPGLVDGLLRQRLARRREDIQGWSFMHPMFRETLDERARKSRRAPRIHVACARMLRRVASEGRDVDERLGRHLLLAGRPLPAAQHLLRASRSAIDDGAFSVALRLIEIRERTLKRIGLPTEDELWGQGWAVWARLGRRAGQPDELVRWASKARRAGRRHGWHRVLALVYSELAAHELAIGRGLAAWRWLRLLDEEAEELLDQDLLGRARRGMGRILLERGELKRARGMAEAASVHFSAAGKVGEAARSFQLVARVHVQSHDLAAATRAIDAAGRLFEQAGDRMGIAQSLNAMGEVARIRGDLTRAEQLYRASLARFGDVGGDETAFPKLNLVFTLFARHSWVEARDLLREVLPVFQEGGNRAMLGSVHLAMSVASAGVLDWAAWDEHFGPAVAALEETGFVDRDNAALASIAGRLCRDAGRDARAWAAWRLALGQWSALNREDEVDRVRAEMAAGVAPP